MAYFGDDEYFDRGDDGATGFSPGGPDIKQEYVDPDIKTEPGTVPPPPPPNPDYTRPPPFYERPDGGPSRERPPDSNNSEPRMSRDPDKRYRFQITKHIDNNRDLYFIKLVAGAMKRRSFQSLIEVEDKLDRGPTPASYINISVRYSYNNELLYAWTTVIEKIKNMIKTSDSAWKTSESIHEQMIENDTAVSAMARYVAFIMMTETNNFIPKNRTRFVLDTEQRLEGDRVLDLMRAINSQFKILRPELVARYRII